MPNKKYWKQYNAEKNMKKDELPFYEEHDEYIEYVNEYEIRESKEIKNRIDLIYHTIFSAIESLGYMVEEEEGKYVAVIKEERIPFKVREKGKIQYREAKGKYDIYKIVYVKGERKVKEERLIEHEKYEREEKEKIKK